MSIVVHNSRRIVVTVGTSVIAGNPPVTSPTDVPHRLRERLDDLRRKHPEGDQALEILSAETNSLLKVGVDRDDEIDLLCTDTPVGEACGRALSKIIETRFGVQANVITIKGLQVDDANVFRTVGVQNLFKWLDDTLGNQRFTRDSEVILNVTGGFKSVVPYVTLYGILRRFPVVYLFERSKQQIVLPPVPLYYDEGLVSRAQKALAALRREGVMRQDQLYRLIRDFTQGEERLFEAFFETDSDGQATLSAFGQLLLDDADLDALPVELSPEAKATLEASTGSRRDFLQTLLHHLTQPGWLDTHFHRFTGTDLDVVKPGRTPARAAGYRKGKTFRVCLLYPDHDAYERDLAGRSRAEFDEIAFSPWVPSREEEAAPLELEEILQKQEAAFRQLQNDQLELEQMISENETAHEEAIKSIRSKMHNEQVRLEAQLSELRGVTEKEAYRAHILTEQVEALRSQLDQTKRALEDCSFMDRLRFLLSPRFFTASNRFQQKDS